MSPYFLIALASPLPMPPLPMQPTRGRSLGDFVSSAIVRPPGNPAGTANRRLRPPPWSGESHAVSHLALAHVSLQQPLAPQPDSASSRTAEYHPASR